MAKSLILTPRAVCDKSCIDIACPESEHIPNKETVKSIDNIEHGKNLTEIDDLRDLFKKLDI